MLPLDATAPRVDFSSYLKQGANTIEIVVATPLNNAIVLRQHELLKCGISVTNSSVRAGLEAFSPNSQETFAESAYELARDVVVRPY